VFDNSADPASAASTKLPGDLLHSAPKSGMPEPVISLFNVDPKTFYSSVISV
jgi:hypothetical protein